MVVRKVVRSDGRADRRAVGPSFGRSDGWLVGLSFAGRPNGHSDGGRSIERSVGLVGRLFGQVFDLSDGQSVGRVVRRTVGPSAVVRTIFRPDLSADGSSGAHRRRPEASTAATPAGPERVDVSRAASFGAANPKDLSATLAAALGPLGIFSFGSAAFSGDGGTTLRPNPSFP